MDFRRKKSYAGLSLYVVFGWWGGIGIRKDGPALVVIIGFVSIGILFRDLERMIDQINNHLQTSKSQVTPSP